MKKITKTLCTLLLCSLVLFLLLPFIFPNSGLKGIGKGNSDQQAVSEPQIFTSNPLTKLVQSLARIFKKEQAPSPVQAAPNQPLSEAQANARFGAIIAEEDYATQGIAADNNEEEQTKDQRQENANAYQNEEGEWVLIQQTTPEGGISGMHEISVKDNAYERYAKYEREARFTPTPTKRTQASDVPDSKLARLFQPIKKFFGFNDETTAQTPALDQAIASAKTGRTDGLGKNRNPDNFAKFTNPSMPNGMLPIGQTRDFGKNPVADLLNMVNPERSIQDAAEQVAESKYPDPKNPQDKAARQKLSNEKAAQYKQYFDDHLSQHLLQLAQGRPATDIIGNVVEGCSLAKSSFISSGCQDKADTTDVQQTRLENQERFRQQVGKNLPNAPIMVVLSKADPFNLASQLEVLQGDEGSTQEDENSAEQKMFAEKYQFMLANKNCTDKNPCYWVAGYVPPEVNPSNYNTPRLEETVTASGVQFAPHISKNTLLLDRNFVQEQLDKLPPEATDETRQQIRTLAENAHTPYILVDIEELRQIQQINKDVIKQGHNNAANKNQIIQQGRAIFAESAPTAWQLSQDLGDPYIFYEENNSMVNAEENPTTKDRAQKLNDAMIASSVFVQGIVADIRRMANEESTYNAVKPMAQQIQKETDEKIKDFTKTGKVPVVSLP